MRKEIYIIGEIGLCHNGSMNMAHELIDTAHKAGINAVKFQKRTIELLATKDELNKPDSRFPFLGSTYGDIRRSLEFNKDQYLELKQHAKSLALDFIVTPFDEIALEFILDIGVDAVKLASHSLTNLPFLKSVSKIKDHIIFSTGMSTYEDIDTAIKIFDNHRSAKNLTIMHCVSSYPTPINECQLHFINKLKTRYNTRVGYSGHEIGYFPSLYSAAMGADVIERHITLDNNLDGFDHRVALDPMDLKNFTEKIREFELAFGDSDKIREITNVEEITKNKYHVSAISSREIKQGKRLEENDLIFKNPGTGIPPKDVHRIIGKKAKADIAIDSLLNENMFE